MRNEENPLLPTLEKCEMNKDVLFQSPPRPALVVRGACRRSREKRIRSKSLPLDVNLAPSLVSGIPASRPSLSPQQGSLVGDQAPHGQGHGHIGGGARACQRDPSRSKHVEQVAGQGPGDRSPESLEGRCRCKKTESETRKPCQGTTTADER